MAKEEHLKILRQGADAWNAWQKENLNIKGPDLKAALLEGSPHIGADLTGADLKGIELNGVDLNWADLTGADLTGANLCWAKFIGARLRGANLCGALLGGAKLRGADLIEAKLNRSKFISASLCGANLTEAHLIKASLKEADLKDAILLGADLTSANLIDADLTGADLREAKLILAFLDRANFLRADLSGADLSEAKLLGASLSATHLERANFEGTFLREAVLADLDLSTTEGLSSCLYLGPCIVDHRTLAKSKGIPINFWRGCGLPDELIEYNESLVDDPNQFQTCFISHSSKDQDFADRLHADLQDAGVRCYYAPHDLPIGAKTWDELDKAIRTRDKVFLILSEEAIASDWVEDEVTTAFAEERRRKRPVLFPVRLDGAVMETDEPWAGKLRDDRNIGDFTEWKDYDAYKVTFKRVLRDLKASSSK